jgi:multiple sugar transport system substrate-binding protein
MQVSKFKEIEMRKINMLFMVLMCAVLLAACGAQPVSETPETVDSTQAPEVGDTVAPTGDEYDDTAPIVVWVDDVRQTGIDLFKQHNPDVADLIHEEIQNRGELPTKVLLWNNIGEGWPDVVFAEPDIVQTISDPAHNYAMDLTPWIPQEVIDGFEPGSLAPCERGGELLCLRSDIAPNVLWYNAKLMEEFGYEVPTTWEEYLETGLKVAQEHPGYLVGACGDVQCNNAYFWPSQCPAHQDVGNNTLYINYLDDKCVRAANLLDQLMAAGSIMPAKGPFSTEFITAANENKVLMFIGASWYGEHVFNGLYYTTPEGQLGAAAPPKWADEATNWTGAQGGASWAVSRHTKNPELAMRLIQWLTTAPEYMGDNATTQPAFTANTEIWGKALADKPLYAFDTYPVLQGAGKVMDPLWNEPVRYSVAIGGVWEEIINEGLLQGKTIEELLPALQERMVQEAEAAAYLVETTK